MRPRISTGLPAYSGIAHVTLSSIPARGIQVEEFEVSRLVQPGRAIEVSCINLPTGTFVLSKPYAPEIGRLRVTFFNCMNMPTAETEVDLTITT